MSQRPQKLARSPNFSKDQKHLSLELMFSLLEAETLIKTLWDVSSAALVSTASCKYLHEHVVLPTPSSSSSPPMNPPLLCTLSFTHFSKYCVQEIFTDTSQLYICPHWICRIKTLSFFLLFLWVFCFFFFFVQLRFSFTLFPSCLLPSYCLSLWRSKPRWKGNNSLNSVCLEDSAEDYMSIESTGDWSSPSSLQHWPKEKEREKLYQVSSHEWETDGWFVPLQLSLPGKAKTSSWVSSKAAQHHCVSYIRSHANQDIWFPGPGQKSLAGSYCWIQAGKSFETQKC